MESRALATLVLYDISMVCALASASILRARRDELSPCSLPSARTESWMSSIHSAITSGSACSLYVRWRVWMAIVLTPALRSETQTPVTNIADTALCAVTVLCPVNCGVLCTRVDGDRLDACTAE